MAMGADPVQVEIISDAASLVDVTIWVPALVSLTVVIVGGILTSRIQRRLQDTAQRNAERMWQRQRDEERDRFLLQERRELYARYLAALELALLGLDSWVQKFEAQRETVGARREVAGRIDALRQLTFEMQMLASDEVAGIAVQATSIVYLLRDGVLESPDPEVLVMVSYKLGRYGEVIKLRQRLHQTARIELVPDAESI